ncbi:hypothetical protein AB852_14020 [Streptomyces uncialis]|uniref:Uncharacterized protein n=1 Tax=Streptomyces uncialis TaxID=1048205 RepID=A0A1Q4V7K7_9ACTN|nr:hypothetical protein AB852_14020 [Streptomyces uncialis]
MQGEGEFYRPQVRAQMTARGTHLSTRKSLICAASCGTRSAGTARSALGQLIPASKGKSLVRGRLLRSVVIWHRVLVVGGHGEADVFDRGDVFGDRGGTGRAATG